MPRNDSIIEKDIELSLLLVDGVMKEMAAESEQMGISPEKRRNSDGSWTIAPMLVARSTLLLAEANLKLSKHHGV